jgi:tubulin polyglutamylase TTLL6/13
MIDVFKTLGQQGLDINDLKTEIEDIVRLAIISIQPLLATNYRTAIPWHDGKSRCFEVLGFDILIDKRGRPWVLEVNWAPALATGSPFDLSLKTSVVKGALKIVNINPNFKATVKSGRLAMSQSQTQRTTVVYDPTQEMERAKETQYHLIYPLDQSHPRFETMERAVNASRKATVGGSVRQTRALAAPKEAPPKSPPAPSFKRVIPKFQPIRASSQLTIEPRLLAPRPKPKPPCAQSIIVQTIAPVRLTSRTGENLPLFVQCADLPPVAIAPAEEFERLKILGQRTTNARMLEIPEMLDRWVHNPPGSPRREPDPRPLIITPGSMMLRPAPMGFHISIRT